MGNRIWLSLTGIALALALLIGIGPAVMAQTTATPTPVAGNNNTPPPNGPRGGLRGGPGFMNDVAAKLGITRDQLMTELRAGKSIAEIATAHNVTLDSIVEIMIKPETTRLQDLVTKSVLTQTEADSYLQITRKIMTNELKQVHKPGDRPAGAGPGAGRPGKRDGTGNPGGYRATPTATAQPAN